jgi:ribokinase
MIGVIGRDANGEILRQNLNKMNVLNSRLRISETKPTGVALIMVNESGDNSIVVIPGANGELDKKHIETSWFDDVSMVVCQLESPVETIEAVLKEAHKRGIKTILNPAPARDLSNELLSYVDLLIPNETEFESLTGVCINTQEDFIEGYEKLHKLGISEVIVTLGSNGAWHYDGKEVTTVNALKVKAIDTTAAGDSFIAGVCDSLARGQNIKEALEMGTKVAAITVTRFGAQSSLPSREEIK